MSLVNDTSPYAPIRLRQLFWWQHAIRLAEEGFIVQNGMIAANTPEIIMKQIITPAMLRVRGSFTDADSFYPIADSLLELRQWVPLIGQYNLAGRQIFDLADNLVNLLSITDLGDVTLEGWNAPFDCFFVRFGKRDDLCLPWDANGTNEYVDGAFVATTPWDSGETDKRRIKIGFTTVKDDNSGTMIHGHFVDLYPEEIALPVKVAIGNAMKRKIMELEQDQSIESTLPGFCDFRIRNKKENFDLFLRASELLVNSLYYIETLKGERKLMPGRDTPPSLTADWMNKISKQRKLASKFTKDGYSLVYLVGTEFDGAAGPAVSGTKKIHWVRGHWRNQVHGKGRTERKLIWIKPHVSGSVGDIAEANGHIYIPGQNTSDSIQ